MKTGSRDSSPVRKDVSSYVLVIGVSFARKEHNSASAIKKLSKMTAEDHERIRKAEDNENVAYKLSHAKCEGWKRGIDLENPSTLAIRVVQIYSVHWHD